MRTKPASKKDRENYIKPKKIVHYGPPNGGLWTSSPLKGFSIVSRIKNNMPVMILVVIISLVPVILGIIFNKWVIPLAILSVIIIVVTTFLLPPTKIKEIDTEDFDLKS
jgi:hypothetical protein